MKKLTSIAAAGGIMVVGVASATPAMAHGYVNGPESRSMLCKAGVNTDCGGVQYEPQSLEGLKGFPAAGPADGQIASAGGLFGGSSTSSPLIAGRRRMSPPVRCSSTGHSPLPTRRVGGTTT